MTRFDWENVARCAYARFLARLALSRSLRLWEGEWLSWQAALELSGRSPF
jgi:hypothetical protein